MCVLSVTEISLGVFDANICVWSRQTEDVRQRLCASRTHHITSPGAVCPGVLVCWPLVHVLVSPHSLVLLLLSHCRRRHFTHLQRSELSTILFEPLQFNINRKSYDSDYTHPQNNGILDFRNRFALKYSFLVSFVRFYFSVCENRHQHITSVADCFVTNAFSIALKHRIPAATFRT